jgi:hypothetical protein
VVTICIAVGAGSALSRHRNSHSPDHADRVAAHRKYRQTFAAQLYNYASARLFVANTILLRNLFRENINAYNF